MAASIKISSLETERLVLEPLETSHADELFQPLQVQDLHSYMEGNAPESIEWLQGRYARLSERVSGDGKQIWLNWVPRHKLNTQCVGYFESSIENDTACLAYFVFKDFQRQGYAKEGMKEVMRFIAANYPVKKFIIEMDTRNLPSVHLAGSLGFLWIETTNRAGFFKGYESHEFRFELLL